jgi:heat shock protein HslJ
MVGLRSPEVVMVRRGLLLLSTLLSPACAPTDPPQLSAPPPPLFDFVCRDGAKLGVLFLDGRVRLTPVEVTLVQQPSGSGFRYAGEGHEIRGKGEELTWTPPGGAPVICVREGAAASAPGLAGTRWRLIRFQSSDDAIGSVVPPDPDRYTLEFLAEGRYAMRLDCNRANGRWTATRAGADGGRLTLGPGAMTRAACPPGSLDTKIAADLGRVRSYTLRGDVLGLALEADAGVYEWRRE